jgi:hypothetical protein
MYGEELLRDRKSATPVYIQTSRRYATSLDKSRKAREHDVHIFEADLSRMKAGESFPFLRRSWKNNTRPSKRDISDWISKVNIDDSNVHAFKTASRALRMKEKPEQ